MREVEQIVTEAIALTGARAPGLLSDDAPVLAADALERDGSLYLIGLIGGKDVGKSALVNALVGEPITEQTSFGPGTDTAVAYVHESQKDALETLLQREVPGRFSIITHRNDSLSRQALIDLPDIDSHYTDHVALTRRMLRHLLYPIWIQSIEKYADKQPQKLLAEVAQGNSPANFVFVLNKMDQIEKQSGAIEDLKSDFAERIGRTLKIPPPKVYAISAAQPDRFDLPGLRSVVAQQKSNDVVNDSRGMAVRQQDRSLLEWLDEQKLPQRVAQIQRLEAEAEEAVAAKVGTPILEQVIPQLVDDAGYRLGMVDRILQQRAGRWPIVNLVHTLLWPLYAAATVALRGKGASESQPQMLVETYLQPGGSSIASLVQSTFAHLYQSHPQIASLYAHEKLWEAMSAQHAETDLRTRLAATVERQRTAAIQRIAESSNPLTALFRWILTIGALLWFPIVQPILEVFLQTGATATMKEALLLTVQMLGATYLLKSAAFLAIWFTTIWLALRWDTHRQVTRLLNRWKAVQPHEAPFSLASQSLQWMEELLHPIRDTRHRLESVIRRADLQKSHKLGHS